jgi:hypothetical protein
LMDAIETATKRSKELGEPKNQYWALVLRQPHLLVYCL